jgi:hypothetical protein
MIETAIDHHPHVAMTHTGRDPQIDTAHGLEIVVPVQGGGIIHGPVIVMFLRYDDEAGIHIFPTIRNVCMMKAHPEVERKEDEVVQMEISVKARFVSIA